MILHAEILIATPESDAHLREEQNAAGRAAKWQGLARSACPHDPRSLIASWWFEGYDRLRIEPTKGPESDR